MTDVAERLTSELHDAVAARFDGLPGAAANSMRLLFAAVGRPVDPLQFTLPSTSATLEVTSTFVDCIPAPGIAFTPRAGSFSDSYDSLLDAAEPVDGLPEAVSETVAGQLAAARRRFDNSQVARFSAPILYAPTQQDPVRWFDPAGTHWTRLSVSEQSGPPPPSQTPPFIPESPPPPWEFKVPRKAESLDAWMRELPERRGIPLAARERALLADGEIRVNAIRPSREPVMAPGASRELQALPRGRALERDGLVLQRHLAEGVRVLGRPEILETLVQECAPVPTTSTSFALDLDYCLVTLQRHWLRTDWLESDEWYVPGYESGEVSAGDPTVADQQLAAFPVAFVAVKNVVVRANWSATDGSSVSKAAGLGPFVMASAGFTGETGTLTIPGVQVIAWLCQVPPQLPPARPAA
jgi:hypothetical protein